MESRVGSAKRPEAEGLDFKTKRVEWVRQLRALDARFLQLYQASVSDGQYHFMKDVKKSREKIDDAIMALIHYSVRIQLDNFLETTLDRVEF